MNALDKTIIEGLQILKNDFGVTYTHIAKQLDLTPSSITRFVHGDINVLGYDTKIELLKIVNEYLDRLMSR